MTIIDTIAAKIAAANSQLTPLLAARAGFAAERADYEASIYSASNGLSAATTALAEAQAGYALGEVDASALRLARDAVAAAEKVNVKALAKAPEVAPLAAAEQALGLRIGPLEARVTELQIELAAAEREAKFAAVDADMRGAIVEYTRLASAAMATLARAVAGHQALVEAGRSPELLNASINSTAVGSFANHPVQGNVGEMIRAERQRIAAALAA